ncbi:MAG TPA: TlyA family RNA methyltransferase [Blastocatellia bacterium]|jgi:23S rRNA (cytidine1920-2'-O)/16S rRNA (cytidine1409-2'-O)-methyltransferase|nr:TlyA family RNA methyltransferase [Blastocatellia bacterium]
MAKERLDKIVLDRGLAESRTRAQAMILAGVVLVGDQRADKPGQMIDPSAEIRIKGETLRYVSRGGLKLEAALGEFGVSPDGMTCIDVGASTGGFTDCLLQHGAARVWAIDVGHNQLAWRIRQDPRVVVLEGQNARQLDPEQFPVRFDLATVDVIFISLTKVLPALAPCLKQGAHCVALIKPQFEVGKGEVGRSGVVTDPKKHRRVLGEVLRSAAAANFDAINLIESPILGAEGNREFLAHLKLAADGRARPFAMDGRIAALTPG